MRKLIAVAVVFAAAAFGCARLGSPSSVNPDYLPPGATNVEALNDKWATFDLTVGGRARKFLWYRHGHGRVLVELRD